MDTIFIADINIIGGIGIVYRMDHFSRTSLSTNSLQEAIELVTDPNNPNENWTLIMEICDSIATNKNSAEMAIIEIRKNLRKNPVTFGWRSIVLTLILLEALVNNCGEMFHIHLGNETFLKSLKSVIASKNNPPKPIEKQVLNMIQHWAVIFCDNSDLEIIQELYEECKQQGYEFPPVDKNHTNKAGSNNQVKSTRPTSAIPKTSPSATKTMTRPKTSSVSNRNNESLYSNLRLNSSGTSVLIQHLSDIQIAKLRSELDIVHTNVHVLDEMLSTLEPGNEHSFDWQLLLDLYEVCKMMQARIVSLLSLTAVEDIAVDLLQCNDQLNKAFKNYSRYMEIRERLPYQTDSRSQAKPRNKTKLSQTITPPLSPPIVIITPTAPFYIECDNQDQPLLQSKRERTNSDDNYQSPLREDSIISSKMNRHLSAKSNFSPSEQSPDKRSLSMKLPPMSLHFTYTNIIAYLTYLYYFLELTPLPDPEPRSMTKAKIIGRERSAGISVRNIRNYDEYQASTVCEKTNASNGCDNDAENEEEEEEQQQQQQQELRIQNVNKSDNHKSGKSRSRPDLPTRIKKLTTDEDVSTNNPCKITTYRHIGSD
ncbi:unnamed protein product [Rotaria socialis]|uniref:TOM1-like protein 2 n=1 Tax=Rotaria socialis TaxID=392032 RepID=A0A820GJ18_9BILA|nr:unnamed protein product [Rotaria socialis]CAF4278261.1 unnamed protein product [Rotaria socialis]